MLFYDEVIALTSLERFTMDSNYKSNFLFAKPSLFSGAARTLDVFATFDEYNSSSSPEEADTRALESDWGVVGQDLTKAVKKVKSGRS